MRVVFAVFYAHGDVRAAGGAASFLERIPFHRELSAALAGAGHDVQVIVHAPMDTAFEERGVHFRFVSPGPGARAAGELARRLGPLAAHYVPAFRAIDVVVRARADVVHFHGATLHLHLALLAAALDREGLVVQHHGGAPARKRVSSFLQRRGFARVDRFLVTSVAHARPFVNAGLLDGLARVETLVEVSTPFRAANREESRKRSGLVGHPIFVSAGRLDPVKDPLTTLRGFEIIASHWPGSRLYWCYRSDELLPGLRRYVDQRPALSDRVRFLGHVPHGEMAALLGSADFLLQASLREWSGYAVLEALAVGALPVVTRIDAFQEITDGGRQGVLFPVGDPEALARGVLALNLAELPVRRRELQTYFEDRLSYAAMARRLEGIYGRSLGERRSRAGVD